MHMTIVLIILVIICAIFVVFYNHFVELKNMVDNAWAQVDVQLQRRYDLIPNLVETVKGYAEHEQTAIDKVVQARTKALGAKTPDARAEAEGELSGTLKSLFAVAEQYPDLKASEAFVELQQQLAETEDKISYMRQSYNDTVMKYNTAIQRFPGVLFAAGFGFRRLESYDADLGSDDAPSVGFN